MDIQKAVDSGKKLRKEFDVAQAEKQRVDATYREVKLAYSRWRDRYGQLADAIEKLENEK